VTGIDPQQIRHLRLRWLLAIAFAAMFAQDVLGTLMVVFESRLNAGAAALMDQLQWMVSVVCGGITYEAIVNDGWSSPRTRAIFVVVSAANIAGTLAGVRLAAAVT
jgi:hypothetical protein